MNNRTKKSYLKIKGKFLWENNHFPKFGTTSFSRKRFDYGGKKRLEC